MFQHCGIPQLQVQEDEVNIDLTSPHRMSLQSVFFPRMILSDKGLSFFQNMIHPTPDRSTACFLLYDLSAVHIRVPAFSPTAIHKVSALVAWLSSLSSHIRQFPPHVAIYSQNDRVLDVSTGRPDPSCSLFTLLIDRATTDVGTPVRLFSGDREVSIFASL
jgi:hypothetical protein